MLAKEYKKYSKDIKYCQPKLDGIRCNIYYDGNTIKAISRKNKLFYSVNHIIESLKHFFDKYPTIHLDGELYNHYLHNDFNKIVSLVKKEKISDNYLSNIIKYVRYNVYDLWDDNKPDLTFEERNKLINEVLKDYPYIDIVQTYKIDQESDIEKY